MDNFAPCSAIVHSFVHNPFRGGRFLLQMRVLRVALEVPVAKLFDYLCDDSMAAAAGDRVVVPFGARERVGVVVEVGDGSAVAGARLKTIVRVLDNAPRLSAEANSARVPPARDVAGSSPLRSRTTESGRPPPARLAGKQAVRAAPPPARSR